VLDVNRFDCAVQIASESPDERFQRVASVHFDPKWGSAFWLRRLADLGIDGKQSFRSIEDLDCLGELTATDLRSFPLVDYIPRQFHDQLHRFTVAQTGGTTASGSTWTAYRDDEFEEAFIAPFVESATSLKFPAGQQWLFVGPSGPHIIGKAVRSLAMAFGSAEPFMVDFDPRWAKKLPDGSFARQRYVEHVTAQAMAILDSQEIGVLFTTPPVLDSLARRMSEAQRNRIRAVHYGGTAITPEQMRVFQENVLPQALHLSGYGNTLFGCCMELSACLGRQIDYFPFGNRLVFDTVANSDSEAAEGQVRFTRLDESMLIVGLLEREVAILLPPPKRAPTGFALHGLRNPHPPASTAGRLAIGLY